MSAQQPQSSSHSTSSARPPITPGQGTHLDPGAYARGTHGIILGESTLVHPRAHLISVHGPLSIGARCVVSEKCIIGGPVQSSSSTADAGGGPSVQTGSNQPSPLLAQDADGPEFESDPVKTTIHSNVYIHPNSHIRAGATIKNAALIEPHVTILPGVTVGSHAKICAGVTVDRDVEDWAVVYGNGEVKRQRKQHGSAVGDDEEDADLVETMRLKSMDKEREATMAILKMAARTATLAKKK